MNTTHYRSYEMEYGILEIEYSDGNVIPTAVMGDGTVGVVNTLKSEDGFVGVSFYPAPDNKVIGKILFESGYHKIRTIEELNVGLQLLFDNPKSIDVVIERLLAAKESLKAD